MMAGHLLHSGGEGGIGEERHKLPSETCVSYWVRVADSLILTGTQHWHTQWRQSEGNKIISHRDGPESVCLRVEHASSVFCFFCCFFYLLHSTSLEDNFIHLWRSRRTSHTSWSNEWLGLRFGSQWMDFLKNWFVGFFCLFYQRHISKLYSLLV